MSEPKLIKDFFATMDSNQICPQTLMALMDDPEMERIAKEELLKMSYAPDVWFLEEFDLEDTPEHRAIIKEFKKDLRKEFGE